MSISRIGCRMKLLIYCQNSTVQRLAVLWFHFNFIFLIQHRIITKYMNQSIDFTNIRGFCSGHVKVHPIVEAKQHLQYTHRNDNSKIFTCMLIATTTICSINHFFTFWTPWYWFVPRVTNVWTIRWYDVLEQMPINQRLRMGSFQKLWLHETKTKQQNHFIISWSTLPWYNTVAGNCLHEMLPFKLLWATSTSEFTHTAGNYSNVYDEPFLTQ